MRQQRVLYLACVLATLGFMPAGAQAAQTVCKDGTTTATTGRGTCSGHGGVDAAATAKAKAAAEKAAKTEQAKVEKAAKAAEKAKVEQAGKTKPTEKPAAKPAAKPAPKPAEKAPVNPSTKRGEDNDPADAIAQCKDGMYSHAANRQGACSRHGGVKKWMKP